MDAAALLQQGRIADALTQLKQQVRDKPADVKLRVFLFQLFCVCGDYEKALNQLRVLKDMDAATIPMVQSYTALLQCETLRQAVLAGRKTPMIFGEPEQWLAELISGLEVEASGQSEAAAKTRASALEKAPASRGSVNGDAFEWIADGDSRFGPVLEVVLNGKYLWLPFHRVKRIVLEPPADLRDLIWLPAQFTWQNDGQSIGFIPVRYPDTLEAEDPQLWLARRTEWRSPTADSYIGLGQRMLMTDQADYSLLDVREILLDSADNG